MSSLARINRDQTQLLVPDQRVARKSVMHAWLVAKGIHEVSLIDACFTEGGHIDILRRYHPLDEDQARDKAKQSHAYAAEWRINDHWKKTSRDYIYTSMTVRFDPRHRCFVDGVLVPYDARRVDNSRGKTRFGPDVFDGDDPGNQQRHCLLPYPLSYAKVIIEAHGEIGEWHSLGWTQESYHPAKLWTWISVNRQVPLRIEEGYRKAVAYAQQIPSTPVVGLGGINQWSAQRKLTALLTLLTKGRRRVEIMFDHSDKLTSKGQTKEFEQANKLRAAVQRNGAEKVTFEVYCAGMRSTDEAFENYGRLIRCCPDLAGDWSATAAEVIKMPVLRGMPPAESRFNWPVSRCYGKQFELRHLQEAFKVQPEKLLIFMRGPVGTGKTKAIKAFIEEEGRWDLLQFPTYRASLARAAAAKFGVPTPSADYGDPLRDGLNFESAEAYFASFRGCSYCGESALGVKRNLDGEMWNLEKLVTEIFIKGWNGGRILLVIDEACQVIPNWFGGGTEQKVQTRAVNMLIWLMAQPMVDVIVADALLGDEEVDRISTIAGQAPYIIESRHVWPKDATVYQNSNRFSDSIATRLASTEDLVMVGMPSKREAEKWAGKAEELGRRVLLVTSETSKSSEVQAFFNAPDMFLEKHRINTIIFTTALTSGVSIERTQVSGVFIKLGPYIDAETAVQMAGRGRLCTDLNFLPVRMPGAAFEGKTSTFEDIFLRGKFEPQVIAHWIMLNPECNGYALALNGRYLREINHENVQRYLELFCREQGWRVINDSTYQAEKKIKVKGEKAEASGLLCSDPKSPQFRSSRLYLLLVGALEVKEVSRVVDKAAAGIAQRWEELSPVAHFKVLEKLAGGINLVTGQIVQVLLQEDRIFKDNRVCHDLAAKFNELQGTPMWKELTKLTRTPRYGFKLGTTVGEDGEELGTIKLADCEKLLEVMGIPFTLKKVKGERFIQVNHAKIDEWMDSVEREIDE